MNLFQFDFDNKTLTIFITAIIWAINFRSTFKNIDSHMDSGSYTSLKFDPYLILIKNILSILFFLGLFFEMKLSRKTGEKKKQLIKTVEGSMLVFQMKEEKSDKNEIFNSIMFLNQLNTQKQKILFWLKIFLEIIIIYLIEEIYFIIANNHILDRLICPIRNLGVLIALLIFSRLLLKKTWSLYRHRFVPLIIIFILSIFIIIFNILNVKRFTRIFRENSLFYFLSFILMGLEMVLIKYLVDSQFINIFLILGIKGIIGTIAFTIIIIKINKVDFFSFFDKFLYFEYDEMYEEFDKGPKILYISSLLILDYLKFFIINRFTEEHLLTVIMITDIIYFPLYCIERFWIEGFTISTKSTFYLNTLFGFINTFLVLIFNEILECKFWGLDKNLKKNISKRQDNELKINLPVLNTEEDYYTETEP